MPKMKTRSGAKKRFSVTASGKVKRATAYRSHILTSKSTKRKRKLRGTHYVATPDEKSVRGMLNI
ncbi:50S ribosomal protein L35 [Planctomycetaceae bacterium]|jgi:large subunit ribosomal protein L35|nr:50S ribosomal protein L35 [Planctomycetaceae bacterium]